jgi:hypothetical protein
MYTRKIFFGLMPKMLAEKPTGKLEHMTVKMESLFQLVRDTQRAAWFPRWNKLFFCQLL